MDSVRTISCKLYVAPYQAQHVDDTLKAFADACNYAAEWGRQNKVSAQFKLQKATYYEIRSRFGLSANLAVRAIARVSPSLRKAKTRNSVFRPTSIDYDARIFSFRESDWTVSLTLLRSRERFGLDIGEWQKTALAGKNPTSAVLTKKRGAYYLDIQIKEPLPPEIEPTGTLGVDRGVKNLATLSDGTNYGSETLNAYRLMRHKVRKSLQSKADKGTRTSRRRNCRRVLSRLSGKERRYQAWVNHTVSRNIVDRASESGCSIVLEDLTGIRERTSKKLRKSQRGLHNKWAFYQLEQFIKYKAERAGVPFLKIDPRYTSQTCASCLRIGNRRGDMFVCPNCGNADHADINGAKVIAAVGGVVNHPERSAMLSCEWHYAIPLAA